MTAPADSLRAILDSVFAAPDYRWTEQPSPLGFLTRWLQGLQRWLLALREAHPGAFRLVLALLLVALIAILVHAGWILFHTVRGGSGARPSGAVSAPRRDAAWYRQEADRLAGLGRFAEAMQIDFLGLVRALDRLELLRFHPAKTPAEYSREAKLDPAAQQEFRELVRTLYGYAFAGWSSGPDDFALWRRHSDPDRYAPAH